MPVQAYHIATIIIRPKKHKLEYSLGLWHCPFIEGFTIGYEKGLLIDLWRRTY